MECVKIWFLTMGGGGVSLFLIFSNKGGGGLSRFLIFGWQGGERGSGPPPTFSADIICEHPLIASTFSISFLFYFQLTFPAFLRILPNLSGYFSCYFWKTFLVLSWDFTFISTLHLKFIYHEFIIKYGYINTWTKKLASL